MSKSRLSNYPPMPETPRPWPDAPPLAAGLADLSGWWLRVDCKPCGSGMAYPLRLLAAERGWLTPLSAVLPLFKCSKCERAPTTIALIDDAQTGPHMWISSGEPRHLRLL
jgi:hypothetical protein